MEISTNSYNNPVNFYPKNTGNTINMAIDNENYPFATNVFASEYTPEKTTKTSKAKKKRKSKRLNTFDSDYLPDEAEENQIVKSDGNFFISSKTEIIKSKLRKFVQKAPVINYFFLKRKTKTIKNTVNSLNNINQNVDELLNTAIPYGETSIIYQDIAKNLTQAANIISKANKDL